MNIATTKSGMLAPPPATHGEGQSKITKTEAGTVSAHIKSKEPTMAIRSSFFQEPCEKKDPETFSCSSQVGLDIRQRSINECNLKNETDIELVSSVSVGEELVENVKQRLKEKGANILSVSDKELTFEFGIEHLLNLRIEKGEYSRLFIKLNLAFPISDTFPIIRVTGETLEKVSFILRWGRSNVVNHHWLTGSNELIKKHVCNIECTPEAPNNRFAVIADQGSGSIGFKPDVDFLTTMGVGTCYVIIFWDSVKKSASMTHHECSIITEDGIEKQLDMLISRGSERSNIEAKVIGGLAETIGDVNGFFTLILPTLKNLKISITETMVGEWVISPEGSRPTERFSHILFDIETGLIYSIKDSKYRLQYSKCICRQNSSSWSAKLSNEMCPVYDHSWRFPVKFDEIDHRV